MSREATVEPATEAGRRVPLLPSGDDTYGRLAER